MAPAAMSAQVKATFLKCPNRERRRWFTGNAQCAHGSGAVIQPFSLRVQKETRASAAGLRQMLPLQTKRMCILPPDRCPHVKERDPK